MSNKALIQTLTDLGLSENEARVYFAALGLSEATISAIAKEAEIKRTSAYYVIESLKQKGLISTKIKGFKRYYEAEDPEKLQVLLEQKRERLTETMPAFSALFNLKETGSNLKYYEGLEAVKGVYESLISDIKPHEEYMVIADLDKWYNLDPVFFRKFIERRAKLPINIRIILDDSEMAREHQKYELNYNEKVKLLPPGSSFKANTVITPKRVALHHLLPPVSAIVIENSAVIEMQQRIFEILWNSIE